MTIAGKKERWRDRWTWMATSNDGAELHNTNTMSSTMATDSIRRYFSASRQTDTPGTGVVASLSDICQALDMPSGHATAALSTLVRLGELRTLTVHGASSALTVYSMLPKLQPPHAMSNQPAASAS
ncbi:hypothetical protein SYNPS1DRAFT_28635 [Syncephalis pseudoplumigaleata]|uniref:Uncharacterized protein n=1 Tax=Syncephalis pseudoplumigaleata TaxID=1712513 RepID=A0A4P9Z074_9FUNG|nr:hypothetical protein SYNPS1DRAFT_28635 [Syncephalis pseudoplumigaleata]|eukprot:RKP25635.1 hypothetical protein SYNPS1DRAFT_28635 [Syncephalis pseudoplumigaleata]